MGQGTYNNTLIQMAPTTLKVYFLLSIVGVMSHFAKLCTCYLFNESGVFQPAVATWYGLPLGAGTGIFSTKNI